MFGLKRKLARYRSPKPLDILNADQVIASHCKTPPITPLTISTLSPYIVQLTHEVPRLYLVTYGVRAQKQWPRMSVDEASEMSPKVRTQAQPLVETKIGMQCD